MLLIMDKEGKVFHPIEDFFSVEGHWVLLGKYPSIDMTLRLTQTGLPDFFWCVGI